MVSQNNTENSNLATKLHLFIYVVNRNDYFNNTFPVILLTNIQTNFLKFSKQVIQLAHLQLFPNELINTVFVESN